MKAFALLLVRLATGGSLVAFAASKIIDTPAAIEASDRLYMGYASTPVAQHGLAALGAVLGIFVILGFLRTFSYSVQFVVYLVAAVALARVGVALPVDFAGSVASMISLSPGFSLLLLSLVLIVGRDDDYLALDRFIDFRKSGLATDAAHAAALKAPAAVETVAHEAHAHEEPVHAEPHGHEPSGEEPHAAHADHAGADHGHDAHVSADHGHDDHAKAHHAH